MKTYNVDKLLKNRDCIKEAITVTCRSKKRKTTGSNQKYRKAQKILNDIEKYTNIILKLVENFEKMKSCEEKGEYIDETTIKNAYKPKKCIPFEIKDGSNKKTRTIISVPLFPDQIIHQLLILASQSVFMKGMYEYSCGSIPKRGIHKGKNYLEKTIKRCNKHDKGEIKYAVKLDVEKCYPSISHVKLKDQLKNKFRGKLFLWLSFEIIDSYCFKIEKGEKRGLPIGYSTSQWLCNFHLSPLDHCIKGELKIKYFVRYMDDIVFFGRNKKELHRKVRAIASILKSLGLKLKKNWQVFRFDYIDKKGKRRGRDLDFLGFRFFKEKTILRKRLALSIMRQARRISKRRKTTPKVAMSFMSRIGWLRHCNSYNFYHKYIKPIVKIKKLKEVIRNESRKHNYANISI